MKNNDKPHFSVLIPVYYKENPKYLEKSLESVINQTLPPTEIIIVKDGVLTDELDGVISSFAEKYSDLIKVVPISDHVGLGKALNIGVLNCKYNIIARMDGDDICPIDRFEKQIKFLEENPDIDVVGSWISEFRDDPSHIVSIRKVPLTHKKIYKFAKFRCPMNHMTVVFRKEAVLNAGNYLHFLSFEDYFLWVRMLLQGRKFANIPESLVLVRAGESMTNRRRGLNYLKNEIIFHKKLFSIGFISYIEFLRNVIIRIPVRLLSAYFLEIIYRKFARN